MCEDLRKLNTLHFSYNKITSVEYFSRSPLNWLRVKITVQYIHCTRSPHNWTERITKHHSVPITELRHGRVRYNRALNSARMAALNSRENKAELHAPSGKQGSCVYRTVVGIEGWRGSPDDRAAPPEAANFTVRVAAPLLLLSGARLTPDWISSRETPPRTPVQGRHRETERGGEGE